MKKAAIRLLLVVMVLAMSACSSQSAGSGPGISRKKLQTDNRSKSVKVSVDYLKKAGKKLEPLFGPMPPPGPYDWRSYYHEKRQTFEAYIKSNPILPAPGRNTFYIQPLGKISGEEKRLIEKTAEYLGVYLSLPVKVKPPIPLRNIPPGARRPGIIDSREQILTTYLLQVVLKPRVRADAACLIGFTGRDIWPGAGWNFVFGQATWHDRVAVWSLRRLTAVGSTQASFRLSLIRTLKLASHESGHMFGIRHCVVAPCNMNGSNSLDELDRHPLWLCPECMEKLCWATNADPVERYKKLAEFCEENKLTKEAVFYRKCLDIISKK